jgi:hypothetical protein
MSGSIVESVFVRGSLVCRSVCRQDHKVARFANERYRRWWQLYREGCHVRVVTFEPNFKQHNIVTYNIDIRESTALKRLFISSHISVHISDVVNLQAAEAAGYVSMTHCCCCCWCAPARLSNARACCFTCCCHPAASLCTTQGQAARSEVVT